MDIEKNKKICGYIFDNLTMLILDIAVILL